MNFAHAVSSARTRADLSKRRLAIRIGVEPSYITHIEAGRRVPSVRTLDKIAQVTGLTFMGLMILAADESDFRDFPELSTAADRLRRQIREVRS
jgi:transcriptional regulator with XRE-family HTH domain